MNAIDSENYADCIRWSYDGSALQILDPVHTERKLLAEVFKGTKMSSFIGKVSQKSVLSATDV